MSDDIEPRTLIVLRNQEMRRRAYQAISEARDTDQMVISPYIDDQTEEQRRFFHLLCGLAAKQYHTRAWKIKEAVKQELWGTEIVTIGGKTKEITKSSTRANRKEYSEMITLLYDMAALDGIQLPPPLHGDERKSA